VAYAADRGAVDRRFFLSLAEGAAAFVAIAALLVTILEKPWTEGPGTATLLAVSRGAQTFVNPTADFRVQADDDLLVIAESLGVLAPLRVDRAMRLSDRHVHDHGHDHAHEPA